MACAADRSIQEYTFSTRKNFLTPSCMVMEKRTSARLKHDRTRLDSAWVFARQLHLTGDTLETTCQ